MTTLLLILFISIYFNLFVFGQQQSQPQIILNSCDIEHEFACNDGQCIPNSWKCDFEIDCLSGEDENDCGLCVDHGYFCQSTNRCIPHQWKCDGWNDCPQGDDEENCDDNNHTISPSSSPSLTSSSTSSSTQINNNDNNNDNNNNIETSAAWKYCPEEIVWLGFININDNKTSVYWIEPKVKLEGKYYEKYSTSFNSGDQFGVGLYSIKYIAKNINNNTNTDDPIFCNIQILVLDGIIEHDINICDDQTQNDYLEWQFIVDDRNYNIISYSINDNDNIDISRARFVPNWNKFYTNCYAQISFKTGIINENEQEIVIKETVSWIVDHLYVFIGLIVAIVLLFCILLIVIIILWRKHIEMKEFILSADTFNNNNEEEEERMIDTLPTIINDEEIKTRRPSILGVTADQLKLLQEQEWDRESNRSQDL